MSEEIRVKWSNLMGDVFSGRVVEVECNVAYVQCDDGKRRAVEIDALEEDKPE